MKKLALVFLLAAGLVFSGSFWGVGPASASSLLFDRGLPTANINNDAGSSRSNVAWADWESSTASSPYWLPGDDFTIGSGGQYNIDKVRVWTIKYADNLSLWGGPEGGTISKIGTNPTVTQVYYNNDGTTSYQGSSGAFLNIYQVDFALNWNITGGQKYQFFVDGPWNLYKTDPADGYVNPFLHASNKDLSGSTQQGADDKFLWLTMDTNAWPDGIPGSVTFWQSTEGGAWDKFSDGNVQIYGDTAPLPGAVWLLGTGLLGLVGLRWRKEKAGLAAG